MIEVKGLTKRYGQHVAVDSIDFSVRQGEVVGFLGPNGAGKSTTMNILTGYISATEGSAAIGGYDILEHPLEAKHLIGYLPELPPLYSEMTVNEYLGFVEKLKKVEKRQKQRRGEILELVRIVEVQNRLIKNLSKGYRQRVGLAQALVGDPPVLILDEPTIGLDPKQIIEIRNLIKDLGREKTVILSSHILPEVTAVCGRIIIINKGRIVASNTIPALTASLSGSNRLFVRLESTEQETRGALTSIDGLKSVAYQGTVEPETVDFSIEGEQDLDIRKPVYRALRDADIPVLMMRPMELSLEEIFIQLTTDEKGVP